MKLKPDGQMLISGGNSGPNQNVKKLAGPKTERVAGQSQDARPARSHHGDLDSSVKPKLFDTLHLLRTTDDLDDLGHVASLQIIQRNQLVHAQCPSLTGAYSN